MAYIKHILVFTYSNKYQHLTKNRFENNNNGIIRNEAYTAVWSFTVTDYNENKAGLIVYEHSSSGEPECTYAIRISYQSKGALKYKVENIQPFGNISKTGNDKHYQYPAEYESEEDFNNACIKFLITQLNQKYNIGELSRPMIKDVINSLKDKNKNDKLFEIDRMPF